MTSWERLNAYVDGDLATAEAAEVAAWIAADREAAARVATLTRLKAASAMTADDEPPLPAFRRKESRGRAVTALAASLVVAVLLSLAWLFAPGEQTGSDMLARASAEHLSWLAADKARPAPEIARASLDARVAPYAPNLTAAGLSLVHVVGTGSTVFLGYRGVHGCRVGLWIGRAKEPLGNQPAAVSVAGLHGFAWRHGAGGYVVLTDGIENKRLLLIADAVARLVRQNDRIDKRVQMALGAASSMAKPCAT